MAVFPYDTHHNNPYWTENIDIVERHRSTNMTTPSSSNHLYVIKSFSGHTIRQMTGRDKREAIIYMLNQGGSFARADLGSCDLREAIIDNRPPNPPIDLTDAYLKCVRLTDAKVKRVSFVGADLRYSNLAGATFTECNFTNADLSYSDLTGVGFMRCQMDGANIQRAIYGGAAFVGSEGFLKGMYANSLTVNVTSLDPYRKDEPVMSTDEPIVSPVATQEEGEPTVDRSAPVLTDEQIEGLAEMYDSAFDASNLVRGEMCGSDFVNRFMIAKGQINAAKQAAKQAAIADEAAQQQRLRDSRKMMNALVNLRHQYEVTREDVAKRFPLTWPDADSVERWENLADSDVHYMRVYGYLLAVTGSVGNSSTVH